MARRRGAPLAALFALWLAGCGSGGDPPPPPPPLEVTATVDASTAGVPLAPLWKDHYDLSYEHLQYAAEPGFLPLAQALQPRSWRCSMGRWEIGLPPPAGGDSTDPSVLRAVEREYYRGPDTLVGADDPANYDFAYLDAQLAGVAQTGAEPFLCFDYMPFTLSAVQNPFNPHNHGLAEPSLSYSNGIRTAPPATPAVYARVVRNAVRHVRGLFAGSFDFGVRYVEIGNEPDLVDGNATPLSYFWAGTRQQWIDMYAAIATELDADAALAGLVRLGGGSFAFQPNETGVPFLQEFLFDVSGAGRRLDFLSYHSYSDSPEDHWLAMLRLGSILTGLGLSPEVINAEWGRALGGLDPVYDNIEHGLFRARVMILMEVFGLSHAHEALLRDPAPGHDILGLIHTGPASSKPVSDVYLGLQWMDSALLSLPLGVSPGSYFMAGRDAAGTRVVVVQVAADSPNDRPTRVSLEVLGLPWGTAPFSVKRYVVSQATWAAGSGVSLEETRGGLSGGTFNEQLEYGPGPGVGRLYVWVAEPE